jgi:hypothetical protein
MGGNHERHGRRATVKGTTTAGDEIILTWSEVHFARERGTCGRAGKKAR